MEEDSKRRLLEDLKNAIEDYLNCKHWHTRQYTEMIVARLAADFARENKTLVELSSTLKMEE